jgi:hypothetical protein
VTGAGSMEGRLSELRQPNVSAASVSALRLADAAHQRSSCDGYADVDIIAYRDPEACDLRLRQQVRFRVFRQNQRLARILVEIEAPAQVAELRGILAHGRPRVGSTVRLGIETLPI